MNELWRGTADDASADPPQQRHTVPLTAAVAALTQKWLVGDSN